MPKPDPPPKPQIGDKRLTNIKCVCCKLPLREAYVRETDDRGKTHTYWLTLPHCTFRMNCPPRENR